MPATEPVRLGRKRALPSCPNPLFLKWLTELRDEAKEKGLKIQYTYHKAINSLNKYPLPLKNAKEAKILQNFGDGICKILDEKLQRYYRENGADASIHALPKGAPPPGRSDNNIILAPSKKDGGGDGGRKKKREYVPQKRSGGYAVLLTLYKETQVPGSKGYMFKMELQAEAQHLCDKSFTVPDLGSKYTAWSSVSTLIQKNLVIKTHNPARYGCLKLETKRLNPHLLIFFSLGIKHSSSFHSPAERQPTVTEVSCDVDDVRSSGKPQDSQTTMTTSRKPNAECLLPGTYEIMLCVDFIETTGGSHHRKQELVKELQRNGVNFDIRKLNVGDFLWVAREKVAPVAGQLRAPVGRELVLDYIVERKRMDDLCGSIIDGRFREQKFRLKRCGLHKPIYLVEECGSAASHLSLPETTLQQAIVNTQVVDGFFVKRVQDVRESAAYLTIMTRFLTKLDEEERGLPSCSLMSFAEFNHGAVKNKCQTVREVFARQLMQISGLSGDKAAAILEHYSTPHSLLTAYEQCTSEAEKEKLLSSIRYGKLKRNLGPALSRTVYHLYCTQGALT
uniref:Crossover junction endonuclease MUS81 n=1 Tax=Astatotilapia calliptera TaxID=8154 RepID=A0AAX7V1W6_ASTCA